jgi:AraC-like DNA-binding protein
MRQSSDSRLKNGAARNGQSRPRSNGTMRKRPMQTGQKVELAAAGMPAVQPTLPLDQRLRIRDDFFLRAGIDPRQFLQAFDEIPGLYYFIKDAQSRTMLNTREYAPRAGFRSEEEVVGRRAGEYLPKSLADHYENDDRHVIRTGKPLKNIIEIGFDDQGVPDWIITHKYPLRDSSGSVVGIVGTMQSFEGRLRTLPHLGKVGIAADFIRQTLGQRILLSDIADHAGISERHLQRLFHQSIGMSIQQFVIHSRVHAAAHQLTHSECPMSEIALDCGFNDQSAFTNTFRKVIGMTPREYRNRFLKDQSR